MDEAFIALRIFGYCRSSIPKPWPIRIVRSPLCEALGDANYLKCAHAHRDVILRFGRFPHRDRILARTDTPEEQAWLDVGGGWD